MSHLTEGRLAWALSTVAVHVLGSVTMTLLGNGTVAVLRIHQHPGARA